MIQFRLALSEDEKDKNKSFDIENSELLIDAFKRITKDVPKGDFELEDVFVITVNGLLIDKDFWKTVQLKETDDVVISPKLGKGEGGQVFKQIVIIVVAAIASVVLSPAVGGGIYGALAAAAVTMAATLVMNALIPPPVPEVGGINGVGDINSSQMYAITGQSNQMKRLGIVPKVYGQHRFFPNLAITPYTELAVAQGNYAHRLIGSIQYIARNIGDAGNLITIVNQSGVSGVTVAVSGKTITITYQASVTTAQQIANALLASPEAMALVAVSIAGDPTAPQTIIGSTSLFGGSEAGETCQYLYAIYDFGLGTPQISNLKIGDSLLTTNSFEDFDYRFVDPNKPDSNTADSFDAFLEKDFKYYSNKRVVTPLSIALNTNGDENTQTTDANSEGNPQEIVLDFVCPRGLFTFTSNGSTLERNIRFLLQFRKIGSTEWHDYNDLNYVNSYKSVGGTDSIEFNQRFYPLSSFYGFDQNAVRPYYFNINKIISSGSGVRYSMYLHSGQPKLLVYDDPRWQVGSKVFYGTNYLGTVLSINDLANGSTELTLDQNIPNLGTTCYAYFFQTPNSFIYNSDWVANGNDFGGPYPAGEVRSSSITSGAAVINGSRQQPVYANFRFEPKETGQFEVRVRRVGAFGPAGSQVIDEVTWTGLTTSIRKNPINTDKRHVFLELRIKATNQLNGAIQTLSGVASSVLPVYDPVTETWSRQETSNPAWVFCDLLTGEVNKRAVSVDRLHLPSILEWRDFCDAIPTPPPTQTYTQPRFSCNFILDYDTTLQGILSSIGGSAQAALNIIDGKYGVFVDRLKTTPVQIFTPRNSKDFQSTRLYGPRPHGAKVKYIDPNMDWEVQEIIVYDNGFNVNNATDFDDLTSFACTNHEQAWRFGRYMIAQNRLRQETINIVVDFENLVCSRGDYVQITQDVMRVGGTPARVKAVSGIRITTDDSLDINPDLSYGYTYRSSANGAIDTSTLTPVTANQFDVHGPVPAIGDLIVIGEVGKLVFDCLVKAIAPNDDMSANIALIEKADAIYDYESSDVLPDYDPQFSDTSRVDFYPPKAVTGLTVGDNFWECNVLKSGYNYYVEIVWDIPVGSVYEFFEIWFNDGRGYSLLTRTNNKYFKLSIDQSRLDIQHGFKVVAVSASGKKLQLYQMPEVICVPHTKTTAPSDITQLNAMITNQVLQLSWDKIVDCDCAEYQIRFSPDTNDRWESSTVLATVSRDVTSVSFQARTGIYHIKAKDFAGNQSANPSSAITTIPNLFDLNAITSVNDASVGFATGTFEQTELLGSAVILQKEVAGTQDTAVYYDDGYYVSNTLVDLEDVYTCRLQSNIRAEGYKVGELMSDWAHLSDIDHLNSATTDDWDVQTEYRATETFASMADWAKLSLVDHINFGAGLGFTDWRQVPSTGDATGRIFQFRVKLISKFANVTPRLFDGLINIDMPDRIDSYENLISSSSLVTAVTYDTVFKGPGTSPNVQISIDGAQSGDYWSFDYKTLEGFGIRFYDKNGTQVSRQFDVVAKGWGRRHTVTI